MKNQIDIDLDAEFPIRTRLNFLNHAGVAPISSRAGDALRNYAHNAQTMAYLAPDHYRQVFTAKKLFARLINARGPHEIAVIPNTSTGIATLARGFDWHSGDNAVITNIEFPANRYPWEDLHRRDVELIEVPQLADGRIDVEDVVEAVTSRTRIVSLSHVQFATGHRIDLQPASDMVHQAGGYLCVDAIQSIGVLPVDVQQMGIDFLAADGHKWMLGPEGCGFMYCHEDLIPNIHPPVVGWMNMKNAYDFGKYQFDLQDDARRYEPGTYNIPSIAALGASIELLLEVGIDNIWQKVEALTTHLCARLTDKGYRIFTPRDDPDERSGIVIFDPPFPDTRITPPVDRIVADLQQQGIILVVREGRLRASPHFYNSIEQMDQLVDALP